jgi:hypothetical protein
VDVPKIGCDVTVKHLVVFMEYEIKESFVDCIITGSG